MLLRVKLMGGCQQPIHSPPRDTATANTQINGNDPNHGEEDRWNVTYARTPEPVRRNTIVITVQNQLQKFGAVQKSARVATFTASGGRHAVSNSAKLASRLSSSSRSVGIVSELPASPSVSFLLSPVSILSTGATEGERMMRCTRYSIPIAWSGHSKTRIVQPIATLVPAPICVPRFEASKRVSRIMYVCVVGVWVVGLWMAIKNMVAVLEVCLIGLAFCAFAVD